MTEVFRQVGGVKATELSLFRISELTESLTMHPDILCWYNAFGEPPQRDLPKHEVIFTEVDYQKENLVCCRLAKTSYYHSLIYACNLIYFYPASFSAG